MNIENQYLNLLNDILVNGTNKDDRTGTGTISIFGRQIRHKMSNGFPLLTTKRMYFKGVITELIWFLKGDTNIKYLVDNNCHIWDGDCYKRYCKIAGSIEEPDYNIHIDDPKQNKIRIMTQQEFIDRIKHDDEFAREWGELGPIYGKQWRRRGRWKLKPIAWEHGAATAFSREYEVDQIAQLINDLKTNPDSRRLMVDAWNPRQLKDMTLPPCHYGFQVYTRELSEKERMNTLSQNEQRLIYKEVQSFKNVRNKKIKDYLNERNVPTRAISLMWNQRSVDTPLGLPFNIASYALLLEIIARSVNMVPDEIIGNLGDVHIYKNQVEGVKEQMTRQPHKLPSLEINSGNKNWHLLDVDDIINSLDPDLTFKVKDYISHLTIKFPLSN